MDLFQKLTLAFWVFRLGVMLIGVAAVYVAYRIFKLPSGRAPTLRRAVGTFCAAIGAVIILAGLFWPMPLDWARGMREANRSGGFNSTRFPR